MNRYKVNYCESQKFHAQHIFFIRINFSGVAPNQSNGIGNGERKNRCRLWTSPFAVRPEPVMVSFIQFGWFQPICSKLCQLKYLSHVLTSRLWMNITINLALFVPDWGNIQLSAKIKKSLQYLMLKNLKGKNKNEFFPRIVFVRA